MATRSPGWKREWLVMVVWISDSKARRKQGRQSLRWFLGRRMRAREVWQVWQGVGGMAGRGWEMGGERVVDCSGMVGDVVGGWGHSAIEFSVQVVPPPRVPGVRFRLSGGGCGPLVPRFALGSFSSRENL